MSDYHRLRAELHHRKGKDIERRLSGGYAADDGIIA
jgi:hypothetical protein